MNDTSYTTPTGSSASWLTSPYFRHQEKSNDSCDRFPPSFASEASLEDGHLWKFPIVSSQDWCDDFQAIDVTRHSATWGISVDMDALDSADEPGTGMAELIAALRSVHRGARLRVLEIVEHNLYGDRCFVTACAVDDFCESVVI